MHKSDKANKGEKSNNRFRLPPAIDFRIRRRRNYRYPERQFVEVHHGPALPPLLDLELPRNALDFPHGGSPPYQPQNTSDPTPHILQQSSNDQVQEDAKPKRSGELPDTNVDKEKENSDEKEKDQCSDGLKK